MSRFARNTLAVALAGGLGMGGFTIGRATRGEAPASVLAPPAASAEVVADRPQALPRSFAPLVKDVAPAVVHVKVVSVVKAADGLGFPDDFPFRGFRFPTPPRGESRREGTGSGFIIRKDGLVVTNNHVVENASAIEVRLSDDRKFKATLVGRDPRSDLAVLKVDSPSPLPVAELGDSDKLRVGQWVIAIGNPFGLDRTVTAGIVSATGRTHVGVATYEAFIQTDASINPGNSGGPLLNLDGRVIGINTAIVSSGQGIGFAIPITMARDVMTQLIARGRVVRGWLGVVIQDLTPELAAGFGVKEDAGVLVAEVMKDSPAGAAGLKPGDVITDFNGGGVKDVTDLQKRVAAVEPGRATPMTVTRDRKTVTLSVKVGEQPSEEALADAENGSESVLGLTVEPLTPETARQNRLTARGGLLVTEVEPGSPGAEAGIKPGDAIVEVNRKPVGDVAALQQLVAGLKPGESVPVYLQRGGGRGEYVMLTAPRP